MCYGFEDYEFWLSLIEKGAQIYKIPEILFHYRKHGESMLSAMDLNKWNYSKQLVKSFHRDLFEKYADFLNKKPKNSFIENLFSLRTSENKAYKLLTIFGMKFKIKR